MFAHGFFSKTASQMPRWAQEAHKAMDAKKRAHGVSRIGITEMLKRRTQ
jgi:hypothetical protein